MYSKDHLFNNTSNNTSNSNTSNSNSVSSRSSGRDSDAWSAYGVVATTAPPTRPSPPPCVKGGVLVFFPSYSVMDSSISHWKQIGIYDKLKNIVGNVISESRASVGISSSSSSSSSGSSSSNSQSSSFMTTKAKTVTAVDNASQLDQEFNSVVSEFNQSIDRYGGCVLMAVCRGKGL
jgi:hypothetical protein